MPHRAARCCHRMALAENHPNHRRIALHRGHSSRRGHRARAFLATKPRHGLSERRRAGRLFESCAAPQKLVGILYSAVAALGGALGAVLSRKAYAVAHAAGQHPDPGTTGYQRVVGGAIALGILLLVVKWRAAHAHGSVLEPKSFQVSIEKWRRIWPWVVANSLAGQTIGVSCMQWALENMPTGIVLSIIATTPIVMLPLTRVFEGEKITARSLIGSLIAVAGVIGLTFSR